jgi:hypothetical protein
MAVASSYSDAMSGYLTQYDELRSATDDWTQMVETDGTTFDEAYQFLGDASASRQNIKNSMAGLSAPSPLEGPQSSLENVLAKSVQAMDSASSGIATYQYDYSYPDYKLTPGWQQFQSASGEISDEYAAARAEWGSVMDTYVSDLKDRAMPQRPSI